MQCGYNPAEIFLQAMVNAAAYTNNFAGATTTALFDIDPSVDMLYKQDPPNDGVLTSIGNLGIGMEGNGGMDIGGQSNNAYALFSTNGSNRIYRINLNTGAATKLSDFPMNGNGLAIGLGF